MTQCRPRRSLPVQVSGDGTQLPGHELLLTELELLAGGALARGDRDDALVDLLADLLDGCRTVHDPPAVDVHVLGHAAVHLGAGGALHARGRAAADARPAARG